MGCDAWTAAAPTGDATDDVAADQFERHGFVHCCFREQIAEIATWWFDADQELVAIELDPAGLRHELRLERSPSRWYPHLYGPIDAQAVVATHRLPRSIDGTTELSGNLREPRPGYQLVGRMGGRDATVRWRGGTLDGDADWVGAAHAAVAEGRTVELIGGIVVPATLDAAYESFVLLETLADDLLRYDGDGFF
jgi:uncharacterized protein (DUF952 family)